MANYKKPDVFVYQDFTNAESKGASVSSAGVTDPYAFISAFAKSSKAKAAKAETDIYDLFSKINKGEHMGASAYEIWISQGNTGTIQDFLNSLKGMDGKSAYEIWLELGNSGSEEDFVSSLMGANGASAYDIWLAQGNTGTPEEFLAWLRDESFYMQPFEEITELIVEHDLFRLPFVYVLDSEGELCVVKVKHLDNTKFKIITNVPVSGTVYYR